MLQWADQAIRVDTLSPSQLTHLLHLRTTWACRSADWSSALSFLDQLAQIQSDDARVDAARIALLCHLGRFTAARDVYLASPELIESPDGPLAAAAVGRHQDIELRDDYLASCLAACVRGDTVTARAAAARAPSIPPLFRSDLLDAVQALESPVADPADARALTTALLAYRSGLPLLGARISAEILERHPG
ncbi:MAG: hypothetical protein IID40_08420, partial [Planctomycetes bacterium]|nr:hypothetical protein [Planctomycetota bacterium]